MNCYDAQSYKFSRLTHPMSAINKSNTQHKLSTQPDSYNRVDFLFNRTANIFIKLDGANSNDTIDAFRQFVVENCGWKINDLVYHAKRPASVTPDPNVLKDCSIFATFYNDILSASSND